MRLSVFFTCCVILGACQKQLSTLETNHSGESDSGALNGQTSGKPCANRAGLPRYYEGSGACTGNLVTSIPLPTVGLVLTHNSQPGTYLNCMGRGWSFSVDRSVLTTSTTNMVVTDGTGTSVEYSDAANGKTMQSIDPLLSSSTIQKGNPVKEVTQNGTVMEYGSGAFANGSVLTKITDRFGQVTTLTRDPSSRCVTRLEAPNGMHVDFTYDAQNRVTTITDNARGVYSFSYDANGAPVKITQPDGRSWQIAQNTSNLIDSVTNPAGEKTSFVYYVGGPVLQAIINANNWVTSYDYTSSSVITTVGNDTTEESFANGRVVKIVTQKQTTELTRDGDGRITAIVDGLGRTTKFSYPSGPVSAARQNVLPSQILAPDTTSTTFQYDDRLNLITSSSTYKGKSVVSSFTYDPTDGQLLTRTVNGRTVTYTRQNGNITSMVDQDGQTVYAATYDAQGQMTSTTDRYGRTTRMTWQNGRVTQITDPLGRVTTTTYGPLQNIASTKHIDGSVDEYTYDAMGQRTGIKTTVQVPSKSPHTLQTDFQPSYYPTGALSAMAITSQFDGTVISRDTTTYANGPGTARKSGRTMFNGESNQTVPLEGPIGSGYGSLAQKSPLPKVIQ